MPEYSDKEIERRRQNALELNRKGVFGGAQPGSGRPPTKRRAAQKVAEAAEKNADSIIEAFKAGVAAVDPDGNRIPPSVRVQAAREWITVERQERELALKEEKSFEDMSAGELLEAIASKIGRVQAGGQKFDIDIEDAQELFFKEVNDGELDEGTD